MHKIRSFLFTLALITLTVMVGCVGTPPQPSVPGTVPFTTSSLTTPAVITTTQTVKIPTLVEIITPFSGEPVIFEVEGKKTTLTRQGEIYASGIVEIAYGQDYRISIGQTTKDGVFQGGYDRFLREAHRTGYYPESTVRLPDELFLVQEFLFDFLPLPGSGHPLVKGLYLGAGGSSPMMVNGTFSAAARSAFPEMVAAGANWINIVPTWFFFPYEDNPELASAELRPIYRHEYYSGFQGDGYIYPTFDDDELRTIIREARAAGLKVYLVPHINPANYGSDTIMGKSSVLVDDIDAFFENYRNMIAHYAMIAEETGVELLGIGCENDSLTIEEQGWYPGVDLTARWYEVIDVARSHYSGKLTYSAAAGDLEYIAPPYVKFWDALDYIGFEWYIPITERTEVSISELVNIARGLIENMALPLYQQYGKPLIFTEVGFEAKPYAWTRTYEGSGQDAAFDRLAAVICYEYLFQAIEEYEFIQGMFIWSWQPAEISAGTPEIFPYDMWWSIANDGNGVPHSIVLSQISKWFHYYSNR